MHEKYVQEAEVMSPDEFKEADYREMVEAFLYTRFPVTVSDIVDWAEEKSDSKEAPHRNTVRKHLNELVEEGVATVPNEEELSSTQAREYPLSVVAEIRVALARRLYEHLWLQRTEDSRERSLSVEEEKALREKVAHDVGISPTDPRLEEHFDAVWEEVYPIIRDHIPLGGTADERSVGEEIQPQNKHRVPPSILKEIWMQ